MVAGARRPPATSSAVAAATGLGSFVAALLWGFATDGQCTLAEDGACVKQLGLPFKTVTSAREFGAYCGFVIVVVCAVLLSRSYLRWAKRTNATGR